MRTDRGETVDLGIQAADVTIQGLASGAQLGRSLAVGDVNGDGVADLIVGEPFLRRTVSYDAGAVYVFHGRGTWPTVTNSSSADLTVLGGQYGQFGMAVAAGDVNHDGTDDLIVGASEVGVSSTRTRVGQAYAIFTSKTFPARHVIDLAITSPDVTITGRDYADRLGISVASGDPNGDGIADMLVGSPMARPGARANAGEVYVIWGRTTWTPGYHVDLAATTGPQPDLLIEGKNLYDRLSWTMVTGGPERRRDRRYSDRGAPGRSSQSSPGRGRHCLRLLRVPELPGQPRDQPGNRHAGRGRVRQGRGRSARLWLCHR